MKTKILLLCTALGLTSLGGACAGAPPAHLTEARAAYMTSSAGLAGKLTPTDLYEAKKSLDKANAEYDEEGDTAACRDLAYVARRRIALADVKARTEQDRRSIEAAVKAGVVIRDAQVTRTLADLTAAREALKDERRDNYAVTNELRETNDAQGKELADAATKLEAERLARATAEGKLAGAMKDLAAIAAIKEESRGLVITLSGSVLFVSGQYTLLNTAQTKLDQVAIALKAQDADKRMVVEGHTDSQGSDAVNNPLSLNRANAVRTYLVGRGVEAEKISALGLGSTRPVTDNRTPENRANNRRVEIIISGAKVVSR